ncbi:MAG: Rrf2 family transcriptional regulator [Candidatus Eisenbacteria bacterium]
MRLITKETDYAIRAAINLARKPGAFVSSAEISQEEGIPLQFLRRILQRLIREGLVTSREGVAGGIRLKSKPEKIRVLDLVRAFQGEIELSGCMFRRQMCANRATCVLRKRIKTIERGLVEQFGNISIADLLQDGERKMTGRGPAGTAKARGRVTHGNSKETRKERRGAK